MTRKTRKGGTRMRPKILKQVVKPTRKVNVIGFQKTSKKKNIFANVNSRNINTILLSDPIQYLETVKVFLETLSDKANKALATGNRRYLQYMNISNVIAEAVVDTFKKHSKLLKDETDELADLLMSTGLSSSSNARNIKEDFAELMNETRTYEEPLDYIDDLAEYIDDFINIYDDIIKTNTMKTKLNPMTEFASYLSADLRSAIQFAKEHFTEKKPVNNKNNNIMNYSSVNSSNVNKNTEVNILANLLESTSIRTSNK